MGARTGQRGRVLLIPNTRHIAPSPIPLLRFTDLPHPERGVARGTLVRLRHGVYVEESLWRALPPWEKYLARVHAVAFVRPDSIFVLESAGALLGMPLFGDHRTVHVLVPASGPSRAVSGVRTHSTVGDRAILEAGGLAMTTPAETAVDVARHRHPALGLAAADAALRMDAALSTSSLAAINESRASSRGRNIARWPLSHASALAETALESVSRAVIEWLGFPAPELQVVLPAASGTEDRPDFLWRRESVAGESDGDLKYDGRFGDPRSIFRRQGDRDTRLRHHVRGIAHWGWHDATAVTPLRGILRGAGLRPIQPEDSALLHSLKRHVAPHAPHRAEPTP
jgi:hypothetical protein